MRMCALLGSKGYLCGCGCGTTGALGHATARIAASWIRELEQERAGPAASSGPKRLQAPLRPAVLCSSQSGGPPADMTHPSRKADNLLRRNPLSTQIRGRSCCRCCGRRGRRRLCCRCPARARARARETRPWPQHQTAHCCAAGGPLRASLVHAKVAKYPSLPQDQQAACRPWQPGTNGRHRRGGQRTARRGARVGPLTMALASLLHHIGLQ